MRLYDHLKIAELEERIQEWQDIEEEMFRDYLSGGCTVREKIKATSTSEKEILRLRQAIQKLTDKQAASLSKRLRELNKTYVIR